MLDMPFEIIFSSYNVDNIKKKTKIKPYFKTQCRIYLTLNFAINHISCEKGFCMKQS